MKKINTNYSFGRIYLTTRLSGYFVLTLSNVFMRPHSACFDCYIPATYLSNDEFICLYFTSFRYLLTYNFQNTDSISGHYPSRRLEIGTSSVDRAQLSRFHLKTEIEFSLRNVVFYFKKRTMDTVQEPNVCINIASSQTFRS
jgi:hypothetical protein